MPIEPKALLIQPANETLGVLEDSRIKVLQAKDCLEGIRQMIRYKPDFVISKIDLPDLSGLSMARILNLLKIQIPLLLTDPKHNPRHEKFIERIPNVQGYYLESGIYYDLKKFIAKLESTTKDKEIPSKYNYHFKEHEWASLMIRRQKKRILIIEEDELTRRALLIKLDGYTDHQLYTAQNGLEGLLKSLVIQPDLILCELDLPEINGMALAQIFHILSKPYPIVFVTANEQKEVQRRAVNIEGVLGYMHKSRLPRKGFLVMALQQYMKKGEKMIAEMNGSDSSKRDGRGKPGEDDLF